MASNAGRILQTVKPHIRMINFPKRKLPANVAGGASSRNDGPMISPEMLKLSTHQRIPVATTTSQIPESSTMSGISTVDDFSADISYKALPERFRRRTLTSEEIEFIERGGPD